MHRYFDGSFSDKESYEKRTDNPFLLCELPKPVVLQTLLRTVPVVKMNMMNVQMLLFDRVL